MTAVVLSRLAARGSARRSSMVVVVGSNGGGSWNSTNTLPTVLLQPEQQRHFNTSTTSTAASASTSVPTRRPTDSFLLETAAKEATQQLSQIHHCRKKNSSRSSSSSSSYHSQQVQDAMNAAEALLNSTKSAQALSDTIRGYKNTTTTAANTAAPPVVTLHRAFLSVTQWCVSLLSSKQQQHKEEGDIGFPQPHLLEHPLLDCILQLSVRTHQLGLGFHLPLYKSVCFAIASQKYSIHSPSQWILKLATWAHLELGGQLPPDFLDESLLELTKNEKRTDVVAVLQGMNERLQISSLNEQATKDILMNLKGSIRSMYQKQQANWTLEEEDCRQIVCLLESSIWKLVDQQHHHIDDGQKGERPNMLKDAIERILYKTEHDVVSQYYRDHHSDDDDGTAEEWLQEATELMDQLKDMERIHFNVDDDIPLDDLTMLYTRPSDCKDIPDITSQLTKGRKNKTLRYSKNMERHIYYQFCPMDDDDDDDSDDETV